LSFQFSLTNSHISVIFWGGKRRQDPSPFHRIQRIACYDRAKEDWENECNALNKEAIARSGSPRSSAPIPILLAMVECRQGATDAYPGGYMRVLVMSKVDGGIVFMSHDA
jgi:hypothetical protein